MKRWTWTLVCAVGCTALTSAQDAAPTKAERTLKKLTADFDKAWKGFLAKLSVARKKGMKRPDFMQFVKDENPTKDFVPRFLEAAETYAGSEGAVPFLSWLWTRAGDKATSMAAFKKLSEDHVKDAAFADVAAQLWIRARGPQRQQMVDLIEKVLAENEHPAVRGAALFSRAQLVLGFGGKGDAKAVTAAVGDLEKAIELAPDEKFAAQAKGVLFEREHLSVGKKAPDIEGKDLDGIAFKLSDYRGKVVMLDFWGDW